MSLMPMFPQVSGGFSVENAAFVAERDDMLGVSNTTRGGGIIVNGETLALYADAGGVGGGDAPIYTLVDGGIAGAASTEGGDEIGDYPQFADGGNKLVSYNSGNIRVRELSTAFDITTAGTATDTAFDGTQSAPMRITDDGRTVYFLDGDVLRNYTLTVPFDGRTRALQNSINFANRGMTDPACFAFNNDYSRLFGFERDIGEVRQYRLSTPGALNTASDTGLTFDFEAASGVTIQPYDAVFNSDGTGLFMLHTDTTVTEYRTA